VGHGVCGVGYGAFLLAFFAFFLTEPGEAPDGALQHKTSKEIVPIEHIALH